MMDSAIEKDKLFRDTLVEKAKDIFEKELTKGEIISVNFLSERIHDIDKEVEKIIDDSLKIINEANLDKYIHEKVNVRESQIANSKIIEMERQTLGEIDFEEVIKNEIKSYCIKDNCIVCKEKRTLKCLREHFSMSSPIKRYHNYGPISNGEVFESFYDEEKKTIVTETKLNFYDIDKTETNRDLITKHRGGFIEQTGTSLDDSDMDFSTFCLVNTLGVIELKNNFCQNFDPLPREVGSAIKNGRIIEIQSTDAFVRTTHEYKSGEDLKHCIVTRPNVSSILNHVLKVDGRDLYVINKAFVIVRRVKINCNDKITEFVEPIFVRIENELNKAEVPKDKPKDNCILTRVFYLSKDQKYEKDIIRGVLVKAEEIYEKTLDIAGEISANDPRLEKEERILNVLDRNTALKVIVNPSDYKRITVKECRLTTNILENLLSVNSIKETENTSIRFEAKQINEYQFEKVLNFEEKKINEIKTIFQLQGDGFTEECEMPNIRELSQEIISRLIKDLVEIEGMTFSNQGLISNQNKNQTSKVDITNHDDYTDIFIIRFLTRFTAVIEKQNAETKDFVKEVELKLRCSDIVMKRKHDQKYESVSDLKFSDKKFEYRETKGIYSLTEDYSLIKAEHSVKLEEAIAKTVSGIKTKKDIFKHQLLSESGDLIGEIEQKTDYCKQKKPDPKPVPTGEFKFSHAKRVLCDGQNIMESKTHIVLSRLLVTGTNTAIKVTVTEPNTRFIAAYRSKLIFGDSKNKVLLNRYCSSDEIKSFFNSDVEILEVKPDEDEHKKTCDLNIVGRFGIITKIKITELNLTDKVEEVLVEERDDVKLVYLCCEKCPESAILLDNADSVTDACNFTLLKEKLSIYDFLSALRYLRLSARLNQSCQREESAMKRFKHRLQRGIFNPVA